MPALNNYVDDIRSSQVLLKQEFNHPTRYIGLYAVSSTDLMSDGSVRMITSKYLLFDRAGFIKASASPPAYLGENSYKHIVAQWWYWYESW